MFPWMATDVIWARIIAYDSANVIEISPSTIMIVTPLRELRRRRLNAP